MSWIESREMKFGQLGMPSEEQSTAEEGGDASIDVCLGGDTSIDVRLGKGDLTWHLPSLTP